WPPLSGASWSHKTRLMSRQPNSFREYALIVRSRLVVARRTEPEVADSNGLVQKVWNYCNVLRDDGLSYGDYVEQLTYLLFLKMADEQTRPPFSRESVVPHGLDWPSLTRLDGDDLEVQYRHILTELGRQPGMLG